METFDYKVRFPKDLEPQIKAQAEKNGLSVNQFVIGAVITALQPVQPQTVTEQPKETPVTGSRSPLNEKIALMQEMNGYTLYKPKQRQKEPLESTEKLRQLLNILRNGQVYPDSGQMKVMLNG